MVTSPPSVNPGPRTRLLRDSPGFRALCVSRAVSCVGDGITTAALVLFAAAQHGPTGVSLLLVANALPRFGGPLAGVIVDRVQTRRLIICCDLASAAVIGLIALTAPPLPALLGLIVVAGALSTLRGPAGRCLVPILVSPTERGPANALFGLGRTLQLVVGPGVGGLLSLGPGGMRAALAVDVATFVIAVAVLSRLPVFQPARDPAAITGVWAEAVAGMRHVAANRPVRVLILTMFALVVFATVDNVALVFLTGAAGPAGYGLAASAFGVGMALTSLVCTRLVRGRSPVALLAVAIAATGVGMILAGLAPALVVVVVAQLIAGAGNAGENIGFDTAVQNAVPRPLLGRVFGALSTAAQLGSGVAYVAGDLLLDVVGPRVTFVLAGAGTLVVLLWLVPALRTGPVGALRVAPR
ncbi:MFS transporter [Kutzneria sp. NPDC051319]|uniref:MFS transporter n=1 Tax=Kutzneria sp. NPDC051319 TaxID=3155047 RepID=UPI00343B2582